MKSNSLFEEFSPDDFTGSEGLTAGSEGLTGGSEGLAGSEEFVGSISGD